MRFLAPSLLMGVLALTVVFGVHLWMQHPPSSPSDNAAWAQAVTATAAIIVTFIVVLWQHQLELRRARLSTLAVAAGRAEAAFQLASALKTICSKVQARSSGGADVDHVFLNSSMGELLALETGFSKFDAADFGDYAELKPLVAAMAARHALEAHLKHAMGRHQSAQTSNELHASFETARESIDKEVAALRGLADEKRRKAGIEA